MTARAMRAMVAQPLVSVVSRANPKSMSDTKNSERNNTIWTTNPDTESITPAEMAVVGPTPKRWKKRTLMATRAAVLGMARLT